MSFYRTFLIVIIIGLMISSCGRRTAPSPYPSVSLAIPAIQEVSLKYRGDYLILRWKDPLSSVQVTASSAYKISIFSPNAECAHCDPILLDSFEIQDGESSTLKIITVNQEHQIIFSENRLQKYLNSEKSYIILSYRSSKGSFSPPSVALYPRKPLKITLPVILSVDIMSRTDEEVNQDHCNENKADVTGRLGKATACPTNEKKSEELEHQDLTIQWRPVQETVQQILGKDQEISENLRNYRLNFYSVNGDGVESLMNLQPLVRGSARIAYLGGKIIGRHIDRYGNESFPVQVYGTEK